MHFQIFFAGQTADSSGNLVRVGLADFREGHTSTVLMHGPSGGGGLLISWKGDSQFDVNWDWQKTRDGYWIGFSKSAPCLPDDLRRNSLFAGYITSLDDGNEWQVPVAAMLSQKFRLVDGEWKKVRKPQFDEFWNRSEVWYRRLMMFDMDQSQMEIDAGISREQFDQEWLDYCVFALRQNYRMTPEVASQLGLFDENARLRLTIRSIDGMLIQDVLDQIRGAHDAVSAGLEKKVESGVNDS